MKHVHIIRVALLSLLLFSAARAPAQIPVTDIAAIAQLIAQLQQLQEQLAVAKGQLDQARALYESMRGRRGMERLAEGLLRNYLPENWVALADAMRGLSVAYGGLASDIRLAIEANAILTDEQLEGLNPGDRKELEAARQTAALLEALSRQALATTSERFEALQGFIDAIGDAEDQKAIQDLQARIAAEQSMLANEANKLHVLAQAAQAQRWAREQRQAERAISGIGRLRDLEALGL